MSTKKHRVVLFTNGVARIITTTDVSQYKDNPHAWINPILTQCKGVGPEFWEVVNNQIVPMRDPVKIAQRKNMMAAHSAVKLVDENIASFEKLVQDHDAHAITLQELGEQISSNQLQNDSDFKDVELQIAKLNQEHSAYRDSTDSRFKRLKLQITIIYVVLAAILLSILRLFLV